MLGVWEVPAASATCYCLMGGGEVEEEDDWAKLPSAYTARAGLQGEPALDRMLCIKIHVHRGSQLASSPPQGYPRGMK